MGLQHGHMAEKRFIVKVLGLFGALADTSLALDAGPRYIRGILRVNGTHGAHADAGAAAVAAAGLCLRLCLQEFRRLSVGPLGDVIRRRRVPGHPDRLRDTCRLPDLVRCLCRKTFCLKEVAPAGTAIGQFIRKGVLGHKGTGSGRMEAVALQRSAQLCQRVVIGTVAENHHSHRQGAVSPQAALQPGQQLVGYLARIGRGPHYHQIGLRKQIHPFPGLGKRDVHALPRYPQPDSSGLCQRLCHPAAAAGGTPINSPNLLNLHYSSPLSLV